MGWSAARVDIPGFAYPADEQDALWRATEEHLSAAVSNEVGIGGVMGAAAKLACNPLWLMDTRYRVVARSTAVPGAEFRAPDLSLVLSYCESIDMTATVPVLIRAQPSVGLTRRQLLMPVTRAGRVYAWLVMTEVSEKLNDGASILLSRTAFHLSGEYAQQRRVALASWNARSALARQLIRGSSVDDDIVSAAQYLGVSVDLQRVLVYVADPPGRGGPPDRELCSKLSSELDVDVLSTRGTDGVVLLVEVENGTVPVTFVHGVKTAMYRTLDALGIPEAVVGVSAVTPTGNLERAYRETREVVLCVDHFAPAGGRVIAVDDLGPARLFVANGDVRAVRRYARDTLGALLTPTSQADLLRTLFCFFDADRHIRETARRLRVHENTVRLRLARIHDATGLDVAASAHDQLTAQTALLLLRLEGHPHIPGLAGRADGEGALLPRSTHVHA